MTDSLNTEFSRSVIDLLHEFDVQYEPNVSIAGMTLDALVYPLGGTGPSPVIGMEIRRLHNLRLVETSLSQSLFRLVALRSSGAIDGGFVVTDIDIPEAFAGRAELSARIYDVPFRFSSYESLRRELEQGQFSRNWSQLLEATASRRSGEREAIQARRLFVCMDYTPHFDDVFNYGIAPVAERLGFTAIRVKDHPSFGTIISDIQADLRNAEGVICDVSTINPNVLYEVGYSHALNKPTILIAAQGSELPFNTRGYRHLFYQNISDLETLLEAELRAMMANGQL